MSLFSVTLFLIVFLCSASYADLACISVDWTSNGYTGSNIIKYISQNASGDFSTTTHNLSANGFQLDDHIHFFQHNGQKRLLVTIDEASNGADFAIYDPANFSAPLATGDMDTWNLNLSGNWSFNAIEEFGSNVLFGLRKYRDGDETHTNIEAYGILEVNPETCTLIGSPQTYNASTNADTSGIAPTRWLAVHGNVIYVDASEGIIMMDSLGHVTGRVNGLNAELIPSGENLYFSREGTNGGLYRVSGDISSQTITSADFFSRYAVRIADAVSSSNKGLCQDGNGGLYYLQGGNSFGNSSSQRRDIKHWDGSSNSTVYTVSSGGLYYIRYDSSTGTMFLGHNSSDNGMVFSISALKKGSDGNFTLARTFWRNVIDSGRELSVINSVLSSSGNTQQGNTQEDNTETQDNNTPSPQSLDSGTVSKIAGKLGQSSGDITYIPSSNMTNLSFPASIDIALSSDGYEVVSKGGSLTVQSSGYYTFYMTVPASLVGTNTALKVFLADRGIFTGSFADALASGLTEARIFTASGDEVGTLPSTILAAANLQAGTFSTLLAKSASSTSGNNNSTGSSGGGCSTGAIAFLAMLPCLALFRKK